MKLRLLQSVILLVLAACGSSARTNARDSVESGAANLPASDPPFTTAAVAAFDNPWAMAFLPGTNIAIVTEKSGAIWLVDAARGQKQQVWRRAAGRLMPGRAGYSTLSSRPSSQTINWFT